MFCMPLVVIKHPGSWDQLKIHIGIKGPTFMQLITGFIAKVTDFCVEQFVPKYDKNLNIGQVKSVKEIPLYSGSN